MLADDDTDVAPYTAIDAPSMRPQIDFRPAVAGFLGKPAACAHDADAIATPVAGEPAVVNFCRPSASSPTNSIVADANHSEFVLVPSVSEIATGAADADDAAAAVPTNDTADDVDTHRPGPSVGWLNSAAARMDVVAVTVVADAAPTVEK